MADRPTEDPKWAESSSHVVEPAAKRPNGWQFEDTLPSDNMNWIQRALGRWVDYFRRDAGGTFDSISEVAQSSVSEGDRFRLDPTDASKQIGDVVQSLTTGDETARTVAADGEHLIVVRNNGTTAIYDLSDMSILSFINGLDGSGPFEDIRVETNGDAWAISYHASGDSTNRFYLFSDYESVSDLSTDSDHYESWAGQTVGDFCIAGDRVYMGRWDRDELDNSTLSVYPIMYGSSSVSMGSENQTDLGSIERPKQVSSANGYVGIATVLYDSGGPSMTLKGRVFEFDGSSWTNYYDFTHPDPDVSQGWDVRVGAGLDGEYFYFSGRADGSSSAQLFKLPITAEESYFPGTPSPVATSTYPWGTTHVFPDFVQVGSELMDKESLTLRSPLGVTFEPDGGHDVSIAPRGIAGDGQYLYFGGDVSNGTSGDDPNVFQVYIGGRPRIWKQYDPQTTSNRPYLNKYAPALTK